MTWFTRVFINPRARSARHALLSQERLHAIIARAVSTDGTPLNVGSAYSDFPAAANVDDAHHADTRCLWRLDPGRVHHTLYIVSSCVPDTALLIEQFGIAVSDVNTCEYEPFLVKIRQGQEWQFRLKANPTRSIPSKTREQRGKRTGIVREQDQLSWFIEHGRKSGFHIPINRLDVPEVRVQGSGTVSFARHSLTVTLASAVFEGYLVVDDPEALRNALVQGIGRGKGYGFGLLTLSPVTVPRPDWVAQASHG